MARIFKIRELEEKKRALADECDAYRQTLRLEMQNLSLQAGWTKRRFTSFTSSPLWAFLPPLLRSFSSSSKRKRGFSKWRILSTLLAGWQIYRKFRGVFSMFPRIRRARLAQDERAPVGII